MDYYKKIDKSIFQYGATIPIDLIDSFTFGQPLTPGKHRELTVRWKNKEYRASLRFINRSKYKPVYQIRWDHNEDLLTDLKKEFIQSYLAIESRYHLARQAGKHFMTDLLGGNQEVLIVRPVKRDEIHLETFIVVSTPYDDIFRNLVEQNVFGWLSTKSTDYLITKSTPWYSIGTLAKHEEAKYVVYYLLDEKRKHIYVGSAKRLGDRVKPKRNEIPGWTRFKYDIIHPNYHHLLRKNRIPHYSRIFQHYGEQRSCAISPTEQL